MRRLLLTAALSVGLLAACGKDPVDDGTPCGDAQTAGKKLVEKSCNPDSGATEEESNAAKARCDTAYAAASAEAQGRFDTQTTAYAACVEKLDTCNSDREIDFIVASSACTPPSLE